MQTMASFAIASADPNLVIIAMGDHQPNTTITGLGASHDVPAFMIAHDPAVTDRVAQWGWTPGLRPGNDARTWPMSAIRDQIFASFGSEP